jgi:uncharacterized protein (DUF305 family)
MNKGHRNAMVAILVLAGLGCAPRSAPYDLQFIDTMTALDKDEIAIAQVAETAAVLPELRNVARDIVDGQTNDTAQLHQWRDVWYRKWTPAPNPQLAGLEQPQTGVDLRQFELVSGSDLDLMVITKLLSYHTAVAAIARKAQVKVKHPELKTMAVAVADSRERQIETMQRIAEELKRTP